MFPTVEDIFHHAADVELLMRVADRGHLDIGGAEASMSYRERVDRLQHIKGALEQTGWTQSHLAVPAAEAIANGCRARQ